MTDVQLVILAAGHGRRFGGLKQLAPVGPRGEAIMDYTAEFAEASGFTGVVCIIRPEIRDEIDAHFRRFWPASLDYELVEQLPVAGTAAAVLSARSAVEGPFAVANADDLYGPDALERIPSHFAAGSSAHLLVAFDLCRTVLNDEPVTRGICQVAGEGRLGAIHELSVRRVGPTRFAAAPLPGRASVLGTSIELRGEAPTSMNLWGFAPRMFDHLAAAIDAFDVTSGRRELLLPEVVGALVREQRDVVEVTRTSARCVGITHADDVSDVQLEVARCESDLTLQR
jgi:hypothetical protein